MAEIARVSLGAARTRAPIRRGRLLLLTRLPPVFWAVVASRVLVLAAGAAGALGFGRVPGWSDFDPTRLSSSFGPVGNALAAASVRWDSIHYLNIAAHGYKPAGDTGFFPFYPCLIHVLSWVVRSEVIAGLLISCVSFAIALTLIHRLTRELINERAANATLLLLAFAPLSLFFTAVYTESLFLALSVGTFYLATHGRFTLACITAACATLTHVEGILLVAPLAVIYWEDHGRQLNPREFASWEAVGMLLAPAALIAFFFYTHEVGYGWLAPIVGDHSHGHSIAPLHGSASTVLTRTFDGPVVTILRSVVAGIRGLGQTLTGAKPIAPGLGDVFTIGFQNLVYLLVLAISLGALVGTWRALPKAYAIYATLVVLLFTSSVVSLIPLRAFDRYMLPVFPLWMSAGAYLERRRLMPVILPISSLLLIFYTVEFARWASIA